MAPEQALGNRPGAHSDGSRDCSVAHPELAVEPVSMINAVTRIAAAVRILCVRVH